MLRRALLSVAILGALAAPAMADGFKSGGYQYHGKGYGQGYMQGNGHGYKGPMVTNNNATNTNVAAGENNIASQQVFQSHQGGSGFRKGGSFITNNNATNTNVAAGSGNFASQEVLQSQSGR